MKIYKEKQFLIFNFGDNKPVEYDLSTNKVYGKKGKEVKGLQSQLRGITLRNVIDNCTDTNYGNF